LLNFSTKESLTENFKTVPENEEFSGEELSKEELFDEELSDAG
jgi:hypothetical protein